MTLPLSSSSPEDQNLLLLKQDELRETPNQQTEKVFAVRDVLAGRMQELFGNVQTPGEEVHALEDLMGSYTPDSFIMTGVLESAGDRMSAEGLRLALRSEDEYMRTFALNVLIERIDVDARQDVEYILRNIAPTDMSYHYALEASKTYIDDAMTGLLLEQVDKVVSETLVAVLSERRSTKAAQALMNIAQQNTGRIRLLALQALHPFHAPEVEDLLSQALRNNEDTMGQIGALLALRARNNLSPSFLTALIEMSVEDLHKDVFMALADTLYAHRNQDSAQEALAYLASSGERHQNGQETPAGYAKRYLQK